MPTKKPTHPRTLAPSLQRFALDELAPFTKEGVFARTASRDFHLFYVGRDDVHGILKHLLSRATTSLYLNMFGYDDEELNAECMRCAEDRSIMTVITLDRARQAASTRRRSSSRTSRTIPCRSTRTSWLDSRRRTRSRTRREGDHEPPRKTWDHDGAPGPIRTDDRRLRRPLLYPAELRARDMPHYHTCRRCARQGRQRHGLALDHQVRHRLTRRIVLEPPADSEFPSCVDSID
jgi:hypothetical protein